MNMQRQGNQSNTNDLHQCGLQDSHKPNTLSSPSYLQPYGLIHSKEMFSTAYDSPTILKANLINKYVLASLMTFLISFLFF